MSALVQAVSGAASSAAVSDTPNKLAEQLRAAAQQLQGRLLEGLSNTQETEQLLQHAAALMQQYYALPAVEAERQLALAQAAAGRSCAYLRCANLGGEGGPAAGQGVGSMRCRWVGGKGGCVGGHLCGRVSMGLGGWAVGGPGWAHSERGAPVLLMFTKRCAHFPLYSAPLMQCLPRGVVLRHRLLARRLAAGRAPPCVPGAGRGAAGGQGGGGS